jgi:5-methylcytosine-specific restriction endonuclease McrA
MRTRQICSRCFRLKPCSCPTDPGRLNRNQKRSKAKGYKTAAWLRTRAKRLKLDGYRCVRCGSTEDLTVDVVGGGDHRTATVQQCRTLCRRCHGSVDG